MIAEIDYSKGCARFNKDTCNCDLMVGECKHREGLSSGALWGYGSHTLAGKILLPMNIAMNSGRIDARTEIE